MPVDHYENFPVASILLPKRLVPAVEAIYAFARSADDLADEGDAAPAERLAALEAYERSLDAIERGEALTDPMFARLAGVIARRNILIVYMCLEMMLSAANLALVGFSRFHLVNGLPDYTAQSLVFFTITVAAAEVAVGLAIIVALFRSKQSVDVESVTKLQG